MVFLEMIVMMVYGPLVKMTKFRLQVDVKVNEVVIWVAVAMDIIESECIRGDEDWENNFTVANEGPEG